MMVMNIICVDIPHSFEEMIQWAGHASHDGSGGMLVIYASRDLKRVKRMRGGWMLTYHLMSDDKCSQQSKSNAAINFRGRCQEEWLTSSILVVMSVLGQ